MVSSKEKAAQERLYTGEVEALRAAGVCEWSESAKG